MAFFNGRVHSDEQANEGVGARVEDYLDDKFQNAVDLENIEVVLEGVLKQQKLLKQQLEEAQATLDETTMASKAHSAKLLQNARTFEQRQNEIDRRLLIITQSETSDEAIRRFDESMDKIRRLDVAKGYVTILQEVENLRSKAQDNFKASPYTALEQCTQLQNVALALNDALPAAEQAAPHLVDHVQMTSQDLWSQLRAAFASDFEKTLSRMGWPSKDIVMTKQLYGEWRKGVERLVELQRPELDCYENQSGSVIAVENPPVLLPLKVMMKPLEIRFKYHFEGDRPTNKLEKPEYFLSHIADLLNTHDQFISSYLQPILRSFFRGSNLAMQSIYIDSTSAYITALLPMLRIKIKELMPRYAEQPKLLSHFLHELLQFDLSLRDEWYYDGGNRIEGWKGLAWEVLEEMGYFNQWLGVERKFALSRYESILSAPDARKLDTDSVSSMDTKPTNATVRVNDLLEAVTEIYRPLTSFSQRLRFFVNIQLDIFDAYHRRLSDALQAYNISTSAVARRIHGSAPQNNEAKEDLKGISALESLMRVYGSADFLETKMADWSDDMFFVDMYEELQDRSRENAEVQSPTKHAFSQDSVSIPGFSLSRIVERTSSTLNDDDDDSTQGGLFDEITASYRGLRRRAEDFITSLLSSSLSEALKPYTRINTWSSLSSSALASGAGATQDMSISSQLDNPLQILSSYFSYLSPVLATAPLKRIGRQLALSIQDIIWRQLVTSRSFSESGVAQLKRDVLAIWSVMDKYLGFDQGKQGMRKLADGLRLLTLEMDVNAVEEALDRDEVDDDLSAWDESAETNENSDRTNLVRNDSQKSTAWTLREVSSRLFHDEESGRGVLEDLGIEALTVIEARAVVQSRVEFGST